MSKWILMPDSFKGTMSSLEICRLMREALLRHVPDAEVVSIPVADGGEGSVEAFLAAMGGCLLYTSPSPRDLSTSRMPSSA